MEMAQYIYSILRTRLNVLMSWGFSNPRSLSNNKGIIFRVDGFIHSGYVKIVYNKGNDLFDISLLNYQKEIVKIIDGIYFDSLVEVIDSEVEKCENYEDRIRQEYSLL